MARVTDQGLSGVIGKVIFYTVNGKNYARSKPGKRKKKRNQVANPLNTIFGTVSKYGSLMIRLMKKSFGFPVTRDIYNRGRGWMRNQYAEHMNDANWEFSARNGMCQLNPAIDLRDFFKLDITVSDSGNGDLTVAFPEINPVNHIKTPSRTMKVNIKLIAVTSPFRDSPRPSNFCTEQYSFIYNNTPVPAISFVLQTKAGAGDIGIVVMALEYETSDSGVGLYIKDTRWLPAAIIAMGRVK
jgi:hypothetical protein